MNPIVRFWSSMRATTSHDADQFTCHPEEHSILTHMKLRFLLIVNKKPSGVDELMIYSLRVIYLAVIWIFFNPEVMKNILVRKNR